MEVDCMALWFYGVFLIIFEKWFPFHYQRCQTVGPKSVAAFQFPSIWLDQKEREGGGMVAAPTPIRSVKRWKKNQKKPKKNQKKNTPTEADWIEWNPRSKGFGSDLFRNDRRERWAGGGALMIDDDFQVFPKFKCLKCVLDIWYMGTYCDI